MQLFKRTNPVGVAAYDLSEITFGAETSTIRQIEFGFGQTSIVHEDKLHTEVTP
jgi:hypothetical protein